MRAEGAAGKPLFARPWLLAIVCTAVGIGGTLLWIRATQAPDAQAHVASSTQAPQVRTPAPAASDDARPAAAIAATAPSDAPAARSPEEVERQFSGYERAFRQERNDPAWAAPAEASLTEAATEPALVAFGVPDDFVAECRTRLCRVEIRFKDAEAARTWSDLYVLGMAEATRFVRTRLTTAQDGTSTVLLYGAREGAESLLDTPAVAPARP